MGHELLGSVPDQGNKNKEQWPEIAAVAGKQQEELLNNSVYVVLTKSKVLS